MNTDNIVDSKVTTMTDLNGKKSKILLLKNETEIEAFKEQLRIGGVVSSLPTKEDCFSELEQHQQKYNKAHKDTVNDAYALGFRHCYHFIMSRIIKR